MASDPPAPRRTSIAQPISAGIVASLTGFASSFALLIAGLQAVGATPAEAASGLLVLCVMQGVLAIGLSLRYRMPISIAWSTPGAALMVAAKGLTDDFSAAVGAFVLARHPVPDHRALAVAGARDDPHPEADRQRDARRDPAAHLPGAGARVGRRHLVAGPHGRRGLARDRPPRPALGGARRPWSPPRSSSRSPPEATRWRVSRSRPRIEFVMPSIDPAVLDLARHPALRRHDGGPERPRLRGAAHLRLRATCRRARSSPHPEPAPSSAACSARTRSTSRRSPPR